MLHKVKRRDVLLMAAAAPISAARAPVLLPGFRKQTIQTTGARINVLTGGQGPPVLLLHGYPQTHVIWHKIAPVLAREFTIVLTDLRGYGDSAKPSGGPGHEQYAKRAMALDQVEVMRRLGHETFAVIGHDRGGRVAHRMALDHAQQITRVAVLDIVPTHYLFTNLTKEAAEAFYNWFFLIQPAPYPETIIHNGVDSYLRQQLARAGSAITPAAYAEYLRCFRDPASIHATCEDYRAAATIDLAHDQADLNRKISCPLLVLWGEKGRLPRLYDVLETWRSRAQNVRGRGLPCTHFLPEEAPAECLQEFRRFLTA